MYEGHLDESFADDFLTKTDHKFADDFLTKTDHKGFVDSEGEVASDEILGRLK
jgi:hypothetical protein